MITIKRLIELEEMFGVLLEEEHSERVDENFRLFED